MHNTCCHLNLWSHSFYSVLQWVGGGDAREINITPDHNNLSLFPGNRAATTTRETDKRKVRSFSASFGLSQKSGCHFPGLLRHPSATNASPSAPRPRAASALASQAELGGLARKVVRTGEQQTSAREPAPQHPPGETSEPPEERMKEATNRKDNKTVKGRGRDRERRGFTDFCKWRFQEPKEPTGKTTPHPSLRTRPAVARSPHHRGGLRESPRQLLGGSAGGAGCHSRGQSCPAPRPDLAAQDGSVWVLRILFQNLLQAPPTHTRNLLHAVP